MVFNSVSCGGDGKWNDSVLLADFQVYNIWSYAASVTSFIWQGFKFTSWLSHVYVSQFCISFLQICSNKTCRKFPVYFSVSHLLPCTLPYCSMQCTVYCWCNILQCHLYGVLFVPYNLVPSVGVTVVAIHCSAICTVHCWFHTLLCHLPPSAVKGLVSQSAQFGCPQFCSIQFLTPSTHPNTKPDTITHNELLSKKWRAISVRSVIQRRLEQSLRWSSKFLLQQNF